MKFRQKNLTEHISHSWQRNARWGTSFGANYLSSSFDMSFSVSYLDRRIPMSVSWSTSIQSSKGWDNIMINLSQYWSLK